MSADILFLDIESTGLDTSQDRIIELCLYPMGGSPSSRRFDPEVPIPSEATAVHGITDADVRGMPKFRQVAASVQVLIAGKTLCGYSLRRFDSLILDAELRRAGQPGLSRDEHGRLEVPEIDLYELWHRHEPRTLVGAAKRFAGIDLEDAHSAMADTAVLPRVLAGMVGAFDLAGMSADDLCALSIPEGEVDRDGKFKRREDGVVVFNMGKHFGQPTARHPEFLRWMLSKDFSAETKAVAVSLLQETYAR
jgi:DNA polymerase-3 subunit epsilon